MFKKIHKIALAFLTSLAILLPVVAYASPTSVDRLNGNHIEPLIKTDFIVASTSSSYVSDASSPSVFTAWGDSLTSGSGSTRDAIPYTTYLSQYISPKPAGVQNFGIASQIASQTATRMLNSPQTWNNFQIIWIGTNDISNNSTSTVTSYVQSMVATISPQKRYLIVGVVPYTSWTCSTSQGKDVVAINNALLAAFPNNFFNILTYMQSLNPTDPNVTNCLVPSNFLADTIHFNDLGYKNAAQGMSLQINAQNAALPNKVLTQNGAGGIANIAQAAAGIVSSSTLSSYYAGFNFPQPFGVNTYNNYGIGDNGGQTINGSATAHDNFWAGWHSLRYLRNGYGNTAIGSLAGGNQRDGVGNFYVGSAAGRASGYSGASDANTCIGYQSCFNLDLGDGTLVIGPNIDVLSTSANGQMNIGAGLFGTGLYSDVTTFKGSTPVTGAKFAVGMWPTASMEAFSVLGAVSANNFIATTTTPSILPVASTTDITIAGKLYDSTGSQGTSGKVLQSSGTAAIWVSTSTLSLASTPPGSDCEFITNNSGVFGSTYDGLNTTLCYDDVDGDIDMNFGILWVKNGLFKIGTTNPTVYENTFISDPNQFELSAPELFFSGLGSTDENIHLYSVDSNEIRVDSSTGLTNLIVEIPTLTTQGLSVGGSLTTDNVEGVGGLTISSDDSVVIDPVTSLFLADFTTDGFVKTANGDGTVEVQANGFTGTCTILGLTSVTVVNGLITGCI